MATVYNWVIDGDAPFTNLEHILEHLWESELKDYAAERNPAHVFCSLAAVANWLNSSADWTPDEYVTAWEAGNRDGWMVAGKYLLPRHQSETDPA